MNLQLEELEVLLACLGQFLGKALILLLETFSMTSFQLFLTSVNSCMLDSIPKYGKSQKYNENWM